VAWITSLETFMMFLGGPIFGKIFDNYGPRGLLLFGSFMHVFGLMMTSLSTEYYQFILAQGICSPIGASAIFYPAMSCLPTWFFRRRALAFGIAASGSSIGGVVLPILVQRLIPQIGFPWAMRTCAFLILFMVAVANLTVRSRIPPTPRPLQLVEFVRPLREVPYSLVLIASFLTFLGLFLPLNYVIFEAQAVGMSADLASYLLAILNAASVFGRTLPGYVADKIGRFNVMIAMNFFTAILILAIWIPADGNAAVIVFAALYGFGSGAFVSMAPSVVAQISDVRQIGVRTGTMFAFISIAALCGNPIGGALIDTSQPGKSGFLHMQIFAGVIMIAGSAFFVASRVSVAGWKLSKKV
jgi:MFS family permease